MAHAGPAADRNLFFGVLALQMGFVTADALVRAVNAWALEGGKPLGQILLEQQALSAEAHAAVEAAVGRRLEARTPDEAPRGDAVAELDRRHRAFLGRL